MGSFEINIKNNTYKFFAFSTLALPKFTIGFIAIFAAGSNDFVP